MSETLYQRYRQGIRTSLRNNSTAYGYSIVATADVAVLQHLTSTPVPLEIYTFIAGAVAAFALFEAVTTNMFCEKMRGDPSEVVALGSALSIMSTISAVATAHLIGWLLEGWIAWPAAAFASTSVYLALVGVEMALAKRAEDQ